MKRGRPRKAAMTAAHAALIDAWLVAAARDGWPLRRGAKERAYDAVAQHAGIDRQRVVEVVKVWRRESMAGHLRRHARMLEVEVIARSAALPADVRDYLSNIPPERAVLLLRTHGRHASRPAGSFIRTTRAEMREVGIID